MKENLNVQFIYPDYELPQEYSDVIETIDHTNIIPYNRNKNDADVMVIDGFSNLNSIKFCNGTSYVLRIKKEELFNNYKVIIDILDKAARINVVITDVEDFKDTDFGRYREILGELSAVMEKLYADGITPQLNILTDRMMLKTMNNCGAGDSNITLAPDGRFYICPAFYQEGGSDTDMSVGCLENGVEIKNPQLYKLEYAPICRNCDAYQCKRCIWLNRKTTLEMNTPSHEQCVVAHLERNASRDLLKNIRKHGTFLPEQEEIKEIDYLDPFDKREEW